MIVCGCFDQLHLCMPHSRCQPVWRRKRGEKAGWFQEETEKRNSTLPLCFPNHHSCLSKTIKNVQELDHWLILKGGARELQLREQVERPCAQWRNCEKKHEIRCVAVVESSCVRRWHLESRPRYKSGWRREHPTNHNLQPAGAAASETESRRVTVPLHIMNQCTSSQWPAARVRAIKYSDIRRSNIQSWKLNVMLKRVEADLPTEVGCRVSTSSERRKPKLTKSADIILWVVILSVCVCVRAQRRSRYGIKFPPLHLPQSVSHGVFASFYSNS